MRVFVQAMVGWYALVWACLAMARLYVALVVLKGMRVGLGVRVVSDDSYCGVRLSVGGVHLGQPWEDFVDAGAYGLVARWAERVAPWDSRAERRRYHEFGWEGYVESRESRRHSAALRLCAWRLLGRSW